MRTFVTLGKDKKTIVPLPAAECFEVLEDGKHVAFIEDFIDGWYERADVYVPALCAKVEATVVRTASLSGILEATLVKSGIAVDRIRQYLDNNGNQEPTDDLDLFEPGRLFAEQPRIETVYDGSLRRLWDEKLATLSASGISIAVQANFKSERLQIHWGRPDEAVEVFTSTGKCVTRAFRGLHKLMEKWNCDECVIDVEAFQQAQPYTGRVVAKQHARWNLASPSPANDPQVHFFVVDLLWLDGKQLVSESFLRRTARLNDVMPPEDPQGMHQYQFHTPVTKVLNAGATFRHVEKIREELAVGNWEQAHGLVFKRLDGNRLPQEPSTWGWCIGQPVVAEIIARRYLPPSPDAGELWTEHTARAMWARDQREAGVEVMLGIRSALGIVPLRIANRLKPHCYELMWGNVEQKWVRTFDAGLWEIAPGFSWDNGDYKPLRLSLVRENWVGYNDIGDTVRLSISQLVEADGQVLVKHVERVGSDNPDEPVSGTIHVLAEVGLKSQEYSLISHVARKKKSRWFPWRNA